MQIKRIFITLIIFTLSASALAQDKDKGISVISTPTGAEVFLKGDLSVAGLSPVTFYQSLEGRYKLIVKKEGYETYQSNLHLFPDNPQNFNIYLKPKTQFKAFARSFLIPGWGQSYIGHNFKGGLFFASSVTAMIIFLNRNSNFNDRRDEYESLLKEYQSASDNFDEISRIYPLLQSAKKTAFDAESDKRLAIGILAGIWAINLLDVLFHFPNYGESNVNSLTLKPDMEQGGGQLVLTHRF